MKSLFLAVLLVVLGAAVGCTQSESSRSAPPAGGALPPPEGVAEPSGVTEPSGEATPR